MTELLLLQHADGCTPFNPCKSCRLLQFLRVKLHPGDFRLFVAMVAEGTEFEGTTGEGPFTGERIPYDAPIDALGLPLRMQEAFVKRGLESVADILSMTEVELLQTPNVSHKSLGNLREILRGLGRRLEELVGKPMPDSPTSAT
jgi:DNA-directed RNA polymerase alpha subunit